MVYAKYMFNMFTVIWINLKVAFICKNWFDEATFVQPVCVALFGGVGFEEGQDVAGNVSHHVGVKLGVSQVRDILCLNLLVFL